MNSLPPIQSNAAPPPSRPGAKAAARAEAPGDQVSLGSSPASAPLIPRPEARADAPADGASQMSLGRRVALAAGLAVVGLAGIGLFTANGPSQAAPQAPAQSVSQEARTGGTVSAASVSRAEKRAVANLDLLQQVGNRQGGGLERKQFLWRTDATVAEAYQELVHGNPVFYLEGKDAAAHEIKDFEQLDSLATRVREQEVKREIREGVEQFKEGMKELGDAVRGEIDRIFK